MRTERMPNPAALVPGVLEGLTALEAAVAAAGIDGRLLALSRRRAAQINGCGPAAGRESPTFTGEERAALALTEAVTRIADCDDPVPDRVWDLAATHFDQKELAALLVGVALTNLTNRLSTATRQRIVN